MNTENNKADIGNESNDESNIEVSKLQLEERRLDTERLLKEAEFELKKRDQRINKLQIWIPIISVLLSIISAIVASVITHRTTLATKQIDSETQISLDEHKYDYNREERRQKWIAENAPKLLSSVETDRKVAKALILFFYPSDAERILNDLAATVGPAVKKDLELNPAQSNEINSQRWGIVVGGDATLDAALSEVRNAKSYNYRLVNVYLRQKYYRTVIEGYPDKASADRVNIAVAARIRDSSYVVNLNNWCPNATKSGAGNNEYFECKSP